MIHAVALRLNDAEKNKPRAYAPWLENAIHFVIQNQQPLMQSEKRKTKNDGLWSDLRQWLLPSGLLSIHSVVFLTLEIKLSS